MPRKTSKRPDPAASVMILGVGSFAHSLGRTLADAGTTVSTYLTRNYGHFPPSLVGPTFSRDAFPSPVPLIKKNGVDVVIPQSIDWALAPWAKDLMKSGVGIFSPTRRGDAHRAGTRFCPQTVRGLQNPVSAGLCGVQPDRGGKNSRAASAAVCHQKSALLADQSRFTRFCAKPSRTRGRGCGTSIMPRAFSCRNTWDAPKPGTSRSSAAAKFIPSSPIRNTNTPSTATRASSPARRSAESLSATRMTNTAWRGELIHPLLPWLRKVKYHGPIQVTAVKCNSSVGRASSRAGSSVASPHQKWHVIEYNIRIGVTSGPMILRMLKNPLETVWRTTRNEKLEPQFKRQAELWLLTDPGWLRISVHPGPQPASAVGSGRPI